MRSHAIASAAAALLVVLVCCALPASAKYSVEWKSDLKLTMADGVVLDADACVPKSQKAGETFPLIVMPNSWGMPVFEYVGKVLEWCENGYIMVEYETRGWYFSGGEIDTAGFLDQKDVSTVITWALAQQGWNQNADKIGMLGISYGAGLSLLSAAHDDRVTTAVSMSGWGDIQNALWENQSPSLVWGELLMLLGKLVGKETPLLSEMWHDLLTHHNVSYVKKWASWRSPDHYLDLLNKRQVPIFMSNNMEDRLFKPQSSLGFWEALETKNKFMLLNQGIHATAELGGLVDLPHNFVWTKARLWLDYWLRGEPTGIMEEPPVQFQLRNDHSVRVLFSQWPDHTVERTRFALSPRGSGTFGGLVEIKRGAAAAAAAAAGSDTISFAKTSGMTAGLPVVGEILQTFVDVPILAELRLVRRQHGIVYTTPQLAQNTRLCGSPNMTLHLQPSQQNFQIVAYLYKMDSLGIGTLLSHSPLTRWADSQNMTETAEAAAAAAAAQQPAPTVGKLNFRSLCADVDAGEHLALGIDMYALLYKPSNEDPNLKLTFSYGGSGDGAVVLELPLNAI